MEGRNRPEDGKCSTSCDRASGAGWRRNHPRLRLRSPLSRSSRYCSAPRPALRPASPGWTSSSSTSATSTSRARDLAGADLRSTDLTGSNFAGANLSGANLTRAIIIRANFTGADLSGSNMYRPVTYSSYETAASEMPTFRGAKFNETRLLATFIHADFSGADFRNAKMEMRREDLFTATEIWWSNLAGANFAGANLSGMVIATSDLTGANLAGANLAMTRLFRCDLTGADLTGTNLQDANLEDTTLKNANGLRAPLTSARRLRLVACGTCSDRRSSRRGVRRAPRAGGPCPDPRGRHLQLDEPRAVSAADGGAHPGVRGQGRAAGDPFRHARRDSGHARRLVRQATDRDPLDIDRERTRCGGVRRNDPRPAAHCGQFHLHGRRHALHRGSRAAAAAVPAERQIIDVSGDGRENCNPGRPRR